MKDLHMRESTAYGQVNKEGDWGTLYRWDVLVFDGSKYEGSVINVPLDDLQQFAVERGFIEDPADMQPWRDDAAKKLAEKVDVFEHVAPLCDRRTNSKHVIGHYE